MHAEDAEGNFDPKIEQEWDSFARETEFHDPTSFEPMQALKSSGCQSGDDSIVRHGSESSFQEKNSPISAHSFHLTPQPFPILDPLLHAEEDSAPSSTDSEEEEAQLEAEVSSALLKQKEEIHATEDTREIPNFHNDFSTLTQHPSPKAETRPSGSGRTPVRRHERVMSTPVTAEETHDIAIFQDTKRYSNFQSAPSVAVGSSSSSNENSSDDEEPQDLQIRRHPGSPSSTGLTEFQEAQEQSPHRGSVSSLNSVGRRKLGGGRKRRHHSDQEVAFEGTPEQRKHTARLKLDPLPFPPNSRTSPLPVQHESPVKSGISQPKLSPASKIFPSPSLGVRESPPPSSRLSEHIPASNVDVDKPEQRRTTITPMRRLSQFIQQPFSRNSRTSTSPRPVPQGVNPTRRRLFSVFDKTRNRVLPWDEDEISSINSRRTSRRDSFTFQFFLGIRSMTQGSFRGTNRWSGILIMVCLVFAVLVSFAAVFSTDIVLALFDSSVDRNFSFFLLGTALYLLFESVLLAIRHKEEYAWSLLFFIDLIAVTSLLYECLLLRFDNEALLDTFNLDAVATSRLEVFGRFLKLVKVVAQTHRLERLSRRQFGWFPPNRVKPDDHHIFKYIRKTLFAAYKEVSRGERFVDKDGFISMIRNVLDLELDPEEEDIFYHLVSALEHSEQSRLRQLQSVGLDDDFDIGISPRSDGHRQRLSVRSDIPFKPSQHSIVGTYIDEEGPDQIGRFQSRRSTMHQARRENKLMMRLSLSRHMAPLTKRSLDWALGCFEPDHLASTIGVRTEGKSKRIEELITMDKNSLTEACWKLKMKNVPIRGSKSSSFVRALRSSREAKSPLSASFDESAGKQRFPLFTSSLNSSPIRLFTTSFQPHDEPEIKHWSSVSAEERLSEAKLIVEKVVSTITEQLERRMEAEAKEGKAESGTNVAHRISRLTTKTVVVGVLAMLLVVPQLEVFSRCGANVGGVSGYVMLKDYLVETFPQNQAEVPIGVCAQIQSDTAVSSLLHSYSQLSPAPFKVDYYNCTLIDDALNGERRAIEVDYLPCKVLSERRAHHAMLVVFFDTKQLVRAGAKFSIGLSCFVMSMFLLMSIQFKRDTVAISKVIVRPLSQLAHEMDRVSRFDLRIEDESPHLSNIHEIKSIQESFGTMRTTIQSFAKYVPQDVVHQLVRAKAGLAKLAVEETEVTVLFSDIESFTKVCEHMGVGDKLLSLMSDYFTAMSEIITDTGGCLLEFIGDAILAVWNAPNPEDLHAVRAVTAALEMQTVLEKLQQEWDAKGYPRVRIRCGLHTAKVLVGNIGAPDRMKYGVLGDGVNTASRLEETNKRYGTRVLISDSTFKQITQHRHQSLQKNLFLTRPVDRVVFKGKTRPTTLHEVCAFTDDDGATDLTKSLSSTSMSLDEWIRPEGNGSRLQPHLTERPVSELQTTMIRVHQKGWWHYQHRNFEEAAKHFAVVNSIQIAIGPRTRLSGKENDFGETYLGDKAAKLLRERCLKFQQNPPSTPWNGADVLSEKHF